MGRQAGSGKAVRGSERERAVARQARGIRCVPISVPVSHKTVPEARRQGAVPPGSGIFTPREMPYAPTASAAAISHHAPSCHGEWRW